MRYNQVYGKYSLGTGFWIDDALFKLGKIDIYNIKIIESYIKQISADLELISVKDKIINYNVMDVGTGRQALALNQIGAKNVDHYDISSTNIKNFNAYLKNKALSINTYLADICKKDFNKGTKYDFIYLQGIIQHVRSPYRAIENLASATKENSIMWFYNYQAGPIIQLYVEALRKFLPKNLELTSFSKYLSGLGFSIKEIDIILDDCGCTYRHLIKNNAYKKTLESFGFTRYFTKDVENQISGLDLSTQRTACISGYLKNSERKKIKIGENDLKHIDHFNPNNFIVSQREFIAKVAYIFQDIIKKNEDRNLSQQQLLNTLSPFFYQLINSKHSKSLKDSQKLLLKTFIKVSNNFNDY